MLLMQQVFFYQNKYRRVNYQNVNHITEITLSLQIHLQLQMTSSFTFSFPIIPHDVFQKLHQEILSFKYNIKN